LNELLGYAFEMGAERGESEIIMRESGSGKNLAI
jgi:hypothetical protein